MGEVYRARDTRLDHTVAIKVLNSDLVASDDLRARFESEAKIISSCSIPTSVFCTTSSRKARPTSWSWNSWKANPWPTG